LTVAIGSGMHLLGELLLSEANDQTRAFILSLSACSIIPSPRSPSS
jgi:hypothetical protein